jgi:hypothetical protein
MSAGPRQPDYGDGGRPPEDLVAAGASDGRLPAEPAESSPDDYRAPEEGGEGPPAEATPDGEPMAPLAPVPEGEDPPFTDPFGPSG